MLRRFACVLLFTPMALLAAVPKAGQEKVTVAQLEQVLAASQGESDAVLAQRLSGLELTERPSAASLTRWEAAMSGEKSRQALLILADSAAFLSPPDQEIPADATPDPAATRQMLVKIVNYVNTTIRQLPNLMAERRTTGFEDKPQEDALESTGIVSYSGEPMHFVAESLAMVTYRDRKEVVDTAVTKAAKKGPQIGGLATAGEFGPILSMVVADALKGKLTWARWEKGDSGKLAVFRYEVPDEKSNYRVQFCCNVDGYNSDGSPELRHFDEKAAYRGEIVFDPGDGTILRITVQAELPAHEVVSNAGLVVEYAPVEIAGKTYICPSRSVSVLSAHIAQPHGMYSKENYRGQAKTFMNDVVFSQYHRFGSESRILTGDEAANSSSGPAEQNAAGAVATPVRMLLP